MATARNVIPKDISAAKPTGGDTNVFIMASSITLTNFADSISDIFKMQR
ncbi:MAG TPA: hypothetical protein IAD13_08220 [Bacteroidetes bacterium]|nr:hypothetical protein [Candidatus Limimorpha avicola]